MSKAPRLFPTTSHTLIEALNAPDQRTRETSLARFCTLYYPAIYGYARTLGLQQEDAQDRVQDFFVEVVRDELLMQYDPKRGSRFSSWLMKCYKNLILNHRTAQAALKRGGGNAFVQFDHEHAEHSYRAAHLAHLAPEPTFDLMLAREIWLTAKTMLVAKHAVNGEAGLISELLPLVLLERWPPRPMPTQEELALRHQTTPTRLKAFFNRTLKVRARKKFDDEAATAHSGISHQDIEHLWNLLCKYGED